VSLLIEFLEAITGVMIGVDEVSRTTTYSRRTDIAPSVRRLEDVGTHRGVVRCGKESLCQGAAVLVYAVEPLLTPEGDGLADVAVRQLGSSGAAIERVEQPHEHVLSVACSTEEGWLEARIFAARGWVFLVSAPTEHDAEVLVSLLDAQIVEVEGDSAG
jgi:hypothetical protein